MRKNKTITCILITIACIFTLSTAVYAHSFSINERPWMPTVSADDASLDEIMVKVPLKRGYTAIYLKDLVDIHKPVKNIHAQDFGLMLMDKNGNYIYSSQLAIKCRSKFKDKMLVTIKKINGKRVKGLKLYVPIEVSTTVKIH